MIRYRLDETLHRAPKRYYLRSCSVRDAVRLHVEMIRYRLDETLHRAPKRYYLQSGPHGRRALPSQRRLWGRRAKVWRSVRVSVRLHVEVIRYQGPAPPLTCGAGVCGAGIERGRVDSAAADSSSLCIDCSLPMQFCE